MGSHVSTVIANIYMEKFEEQETGEIEMLRSISKVTLS